MRAASHQRAFLTPCALSFQVNITLKWTPGSLASGAPLEPSGQPVTGNPLGSDGSRRRLQAGGSPDSSSKALPKVVCKMKLNPWDQCGEWH